MADADGATPPGGSTPPPAPDAADDGGGGGGGGGGSGLPMPPRGVLRALGLVTKAEHEAAVRAAREGSGPSTLTIRTAELAAVRAELAARTAEADELKRREGALTQRLHAREEELAQHAAAFGGMQTHLTSLTRDAAELARRELEESIYVPFSSDFSVRCRSGRLAMALGTNTLGSRVGSALYVRLRPGLALGGSVAYNVQSDVVERLLLGGTLSAGPHALKVAAERHGVVNMLYSLKLSRSVGLHVKAQLNESHSTLRNLGASVAFNL